MKALPSAVRWDAEGPALILLDQTKLPRVTVFLRLTEAEEVEQAIRRLQVRGAPAIGLAAAWGLILGLRQAAGSNRSELEAAFKGVTKHLLNSRPTAVNLRWALEKLGRIFYLQPPSLRREPLLKALEAEAARLQADDEVVGLRLGEHGLTLLQPGWGLLTHCNAGSLATAKWGTALAPIHLGQERGFGFTVWADETRPLLQGSRLTAWELQQSGVEVTLICDNMAASVLASGKVQAVVVGCDRVAANGDVANKIGTLGLAVLARHFGVPFYVFAPTSTLDHDCPSGASIPIEERGRDEVISFSGSAPSAPESVKVFNPAFDVTPATLVTALVTDRGILWPPYGPALEKLQEESHG